MNELIKLQPQTINGNAVETVNAKELYGFLEVRSKFADWIKNRISDYYFVENQDFTTVSKNLENGDIYFCLVDVANVLGIQNSRDVVAKQLDEKGVAKIYTPTNGGTQELPIRRKGCT